MKVAMLPHLSHFRSGQSGIKRVIEAWFKYMPSMGVEFNEPNTGGWDLRVAHAGVTDGECDVAILHGMYWTGSYQGQQWEWHSNRRIVNSIRQAKEITVPSSWVAETFQRDMKISPHVIGHGIDWEDWQHEKESQQFVLWNKNRAFDVCDPLPVTELAKRFESVKFITTFARATPPNNVSVIGLQTHDDMKELIQTAGVYLSSTKETFGIGTLEAMAAGIPVLGFNHGGNKDLVQHGVNGYLAEPGNFDDLADGLVYCMKNWRVLGANGRELARAWTWEESCAKTVAVFEKALQPDPPTVSIIIPSFNYADKVGRAIESAINQSYARVSEIIIVDDGSDDNGATRKEVERFSSRDSRVKYIRQQNQGVAIARNNGINAGSGLYVSCLDADDAIEPEFISLCIKELETDRSIGIAYTGLKWIKPDGSTGVSKWPEEYDYDQQIKRRNQIPTCCVFRKEIWERLGGFKSRYCPGGAGSEDAEFWTRAGSLGLGAKKVTDAPLFIYSWQSGQTSQKDYSEVDWLAWHPWVKDQQHPFASVATPKNKISHPVREYDQPLVSVIIPVGPGHEELVKDALDSLEAQTFRNWEVIVVNDTGKDDLFEIEKAYPYWRWIDTDGPIGAGFARNMGANMARAPFLLFLDADDWLDPRCIEEMLEEWRHEDAIIYSDYVEKTTVHDPVAFKESLKKRKYAKIYSEDGNDFIIGSRSADFDYDRAIIQPDLKVPYIWNLVTSLVPKIWHDEIGGFDESMESWEDWDYYLRMAMAGKCFVRIPKELVIYRFTTGQRRHTASADTQASRQLAQKLIEYLQSKYKKIEVQVCKCSGKKSRSSSVAAPLAMAAGAQAKTNGKNEMSDDDFVMIKYMHPNQGQHSVVGSVSKNKYGHRKKGDEFLVHKDDIAAFPHLFIALEGTVTPPPIVRRELVQPTAMVEIPVREEITPPKEASWLSGVIDEEAEDQEVFNLQLIPGVTDQIAEQFEADGIASPDDILALGVDGLKAYTGIGEVKAVLITEAIQKIKESDALLKETA